MAGTHATKSSAESTAGDFVRRWGIGVLLAALVGPLVAAATAAPVLDDWVIAELVVQPTRADGLVEFGWEVEVDWVGEADGDPRFEGAGISMADEFNFFAAYPRLGGETHATTLTPVGGQQVDLTSAAEQGGTTAHGFGVSAIGGGRWFFVVMGSGMMLNDVRHGRPHVIDGELLHFEVHRGHGTRAVRSLDPEGVGVGVGSGPQATGTAVHTRELDHGVYGALLAGECGTCVATWRSPDGRGGELTSLEGPVGGTSQGTVFEFAGPPGTWQWSWTGHRAPGPLDALAPNDATFVLYAPIGDLHPAFDLVAD